MKHQELIALIIILIFAFFIRIYSLGTPPLWIDEAISAQASANILHKGIPVFDSGVLYNRAYVFHYLQAAFLLLGKTDFLARFISVIFGLLTILLAYFMGKEYAKSGGIIAALFTAIFYLEVFYSRQARFYQFFQLMFFAAIYLLYKSKDKPIYLLPALLSFLIAIDTQPAGLILAPFFILHILAYNKRYTKILAIIPIIPLINRAKQLTTLTAKSSKSAINYAASYFSFAKNINYILIIFIPGLIAGYFRKKRLTVLIILPSLILLLSIFSLKTFALRYSYFFIFPLILFASLVFSFLYEKFGRQIIPIILVIIILPSNLFFANTYVNILIPVNYNYNDFSAPEIQLKELPAGLNSEIVGTNFTLITFFSPSVEWYLRKPDWVIASSMNGVKENETAYLSSEGKLVDVYSGSRILKQANVSGGFFLIADSFSVSKLNEVQVQNFEELTKGCSVAYSNTSVIIYRCV